MNLPLKRKTISSNHRAIRRITRRLFAIRDANQPMLTSLQALTVQEEDLASLYKKARRCQAILVDEELDADLQTADEEAYLALESSLEEASNLCQELMVCKTAACLSAELFDSMQTVSQLMTDHPDKVYPEEFKDMGKLLEEMSDVLRQSTLSMDHHLRAEAKQHKARLAELRSTAADAKTTPIIIKPDERDQDLPKTSIKKFSGGLAEWHAFWGRFNGAVHSNPAIKEHKKLALLTDLVTDPALHDFMVTVNDGAPGRYQEAVDYLTGRFDRPRELHSIYCHKLANLQPIKGTSEQLSAAADAVHSAVCGIRRSGFTSIDEIATSLVAPILPDHIRQLWETKTEAAGCVPNVDEWITFIRQKATQADRAQKPATILSSSSHKKNPPEQNQQKGTKKPWKPKREGGVYVANSQPTESTSRNNPTRSSSNTCKVSCILCNQLHYAFSCKLFLDMGVAQRKSHVQSASLCSNCLRPGHTTSNCTSTFRCRLCKGAHNTLLHVDSNAAPVNHTSVSQDTPLLQKEGLLMTSQVRLTGPKGQTTVVTAMVDSGASVPVLSGRVMSRLQLKPLDEWLTLTGIEGPGSPIPRPTAWVTVSSMNSDWKRAIKTTILPKVTSDMPRHNLQAVRELPHLRDLAPLADPSFHVPKRVDLLLDVDCLNDILLPDKVSGPIGTPSAWRTLLGWGIMGSYSPAQLSQSKHSLSVVASSPGEEVGLNSQLTRFWTQEELTRSSKVFSSMEKAVQLHFSSTHQYLPQKKRYMVSLPRQEGSLQLGESRPIAERRFLSNEASLIRKGNLEQFQGVMQEYIDLGHARLVTPQELGFPSTMSYYLPIHAVFKHSSSTTKLRIVFDASCSSTTGVSLNDMLAAGPTLHPPLDQILMRFRTYLVAVTGDISKMYREVELCPSDRQLHRFLWRPEKTQPIGDYLMNRVTFGVTSSPYVAVKVLQQTADDHSSPTSSAHWHIHHSFYVDDLLAGAEDEDSALQLYQDLRQVLLQGGFQLRKWRSSSSQVLDQIPLELQEAMPDKEMVDSHSANYPKALGIAWDSRKDALSVQVQLPDQFRCTKRGVASDTAKSFDVLGWLSPFMLNMKILFQDMWKEQVDWDTPLKEELVVRHKQWREELPLLKNITIPRCYFSKGKRKHVELHGFSDASTLAYSAVVYVRATYDDGSVSSMLVVAKTKVAPLKSVSIPRLELCGAVLLTELLVSTGAALQVDQSQWYGWCDSTAALGWLRGCPSRFKTYVANRVALAADNLAPEQWKHVSTNHNPADCASRGLSADELIHHPLWWHGPPWLLLDPIPIRPQPGVEAKDPEVAAEEKEVSIHTVIAKVTGGWEFRFNNYNKLIRGTAQAFLFCRILLSTRPGRSRIKPCSLTVQQLKEAEEFLHKQSQQRSFGEDLSRLSASTPQPVKKSSRLKAVNPFLNRQGVLSVGGRLGKSLVSPLQAHPTILCSSDHLTKLIFSHYHQELLHCGPTLLLSHLSTMFYVVAARKLARSVCASCITCRRRAPRALSQMMGELPAPRVNPALCFFNTGLDYAGPIQLKRGNPRKPTYVKGYLAIFVCLATKAVHIEVVSDQSTAALLSALRRFCSLKGLPRHIYSDNGSNFVGARHELHNLYILLSLPSTEAAIRSCLMSKKIDWHTIPQRAPHFGGIWEAAVKSTKHHLKRTVGSTKLYYEEMATVTHQIAACLNSRPYLSLDCQDSDGELPLTSGHFLIGRPLQSYPEEPGEVDLTLTDRWKLCQSLVQQFWESWSRSYLSSLQKRNKWVKPTPNLKEGDLVMMLDESKLQSSPMAKPLISTWRMGKITATYPGSDGLVRAADVEVPLTIFPSYYHTTTRKLNPADITIRKTVYRRPVVKLARLMSARSTVCDDLTQGEDVLA